MKPVLPALLLSFLLLAACSSAPQAVRGPFLFDCGGPTGVFVATYLDTKPPVMRLRRDREEVELTPQVSASGARYEGGGASFWEHQGEAEITWGTGKPMTCKSLGERK